jgi:hypothetical protein
MPSCEIRKSSPFIDPSIIVEVPKVVVSSFSLLSSKIVHFPETVEHFN